MKKNNDLANSLRTFQLREEKEMDAQEIAKLRAEKRMLQGKIFELEKKVEEKNEENRMLRAQIHKLEKAVKLLQRFAGSVDESLVATNQGNG
ncbi:MAG: hypothetical protein WC445_04800 [Patescibacteria group bacterium]